MLHWTSLRLACGVTLAAFFLAVPSASRAQSGYSLLALGSISGYSSIGNAINASGQVAGNATAPDGSQVAVVWNGTTPTYLTSLGGIPPLSRSFSAATGINNSGQVTGYSSAPFSSYSHSVLWNGTTPTDLNLPMGNASQGNAINDSGQIAGSYSLGGGRDRDRPILWTAGVPTALPDLNGYGSQGLAINASGQMAGYAVIGSLSGSRATVWTGNKITLLDSLSSGLYINDAALAINAKGQIAGSSLASRATSTAGPFHATRWIGTTPTDLGVLSGSGNEQSAGEGINASGDIVGYSGQDAFLYTGGHMLDLNMFLPSGSGWQLTNATAINDNGWITGQGTLNGQQQAFLLKPNAAPEPSALALFGVGAVVMGMGLRRRK